MCSSDLVRLARTDAGYRAVLLRRTSVENDVSMDKRFAVLMPDGCRRTDIYVHYLSIIQKFYWEVSATEQK